MNEGRARRGGEEGGPIKNKRDSEKFGWGGTRVHIAHGAIKIYKGT